MKQRNDVRRSLGQHDEYLGCWNGAIVKGECLDAVTKSEGCEEVGANSGGQRVAGATMPGGLIYTQK